ncbi:HtaA domain-containing protein [Corynebacterium pyruviciproducens]|uniref:HtaA domain-containing protein n=1 Tax=Corynebacterium pyruviciproducens TaxID=598660 RepID=UPI0023F466C4|nr:HtaA domain-containing protein [Corynebacterium pyruviciproducens]
MPVTLTRRLLALVAATFLVLLSTVAGGGTPVAAADTCKEVTSGALHWGVKESYRKYIATGAAHGAIDFSDGASDFSFPLASADITSDSAGTIRFKGGVHFTGHHAHDVNLLDMKLYNFTLRVDGDQGELLVDYDSRAFEGMDYNHIGPMTHGSGEVLATVRFAQPVKFGSSSVSLAGSTNLTERGATIFGGFYEPGLQLDDLGGSLGMCGGSAGSGSTGGASTGGGSGFVGKTDSGATTGVAGLVGNLNDTLVEVNGLIVNSGNVMDNSTKLLGRVNGIPAAPTGTGGTAGTAGNSTGNSTANSAATTKAEHYVGTVGAPAAGETQRSGRSEGTGGGTQTSKDVCSAGTGVTSATAQWGVRSSFRNYIRGSIAKGGWKLGGVSWDEGSGAFVFNGDQGAVNQSEGTIAFPGTLNFYGHGGILDMTISNIEIQFSGQSGQLVATVTSNDVEGTAHDYGRVAIADLAFSTLDVSDGAASGTANATLTSAGAAAFADFYEPGAPLDPVSFTASLGGAANCAAGQGATAGAGGSAGAGPGDSKAKAAALKAGGGLLDTQATTSDSRDGAPKGDQFKIKTSTAGGQATNLDSTVVLLIVAAFVVGGSALSGTARRVGGK